MFGNIQNKENFSTMDTWDTEIVLMLIVYMVWLLLWVTTIVSAIKLAKTNGRNSGVGLIISVISWPFFWLFKFSGALGGKK